MSAGSERNAPCPCGSGRKYKKCHGREATESPEMAAAAEFHRYGQELVPKLYRYADRQLGIDLIEILAPMITDEAQVPFWGAIQLFHEEIDAQPVVDWVLADPTFRLTPIERAVLEAEREAWLSVWEVVSVALGTSVVVRDLLTGVERTVTDSLASTTLVPHDGILGRVATYRGVHVFTGLYPNALPPMETARVVDEMRRKLRRKGDIPVERLRPIKIVAHLVEWWETVVELSFARANHLPDLRNTDGDDLLLTTDHFAVREEDRAALRACVAAMPDVDAPPLDAPEEEQFIFLSSSQGAGLPTILGVLRPNRAGVALETNSIERADRLRAALERHAGNLVRHRIREHPSHTADPRASHPQAELPDADRDTIIADFLARYYRGWLDTPVPALDNQTPRAAVKSRDGRRQVEVLLAEFEHRGLMGGVGPQPDVAALRRELGL